MVKVAVVASMVPAARAVAAGEVAVVAAEAAPVPVAFMARTLNW